MIKQLFFMAGFLLCLTVATMIGYRIGIAVEHDRQGITINMLPESIRDIQRKIGANPDGIWGPETTKKYERWYCDQSGQYHCKKAGM